MFGAPTTTAAWRTPGTHAAIDETNEKEFARSAAQEQKLMYKDVLNKLAKLPDDQRAVLLLIAAEDLSYTDACLLTFKRHIRLPTYSRWTCVAREGHRGRNDMRRCRERNASVGSTGRSQRISLPRFLLHRQLGSF